MQVLRLMGGGGGAMLHILLEHACKSLTRTAIKCGTFNTLRPKENSVLLLYTLYRN